MTYVIFQKTFSQLAKLTKRVLRRAFENKKVKKILGFNLAAVVLFTGIAGSPISAFTSTQTEIVSLTVDVAKLTTENSVRFPVDSFVVSQTYHAFHPGIDIKEIKGAPVYPIMDGTMEGVFYDRFGYGNHILINHGSGFKSLYAHLSKIIVKKDEAVDKNTVIGLVGSTGWSTGSHLHLEVHDNGRPFNPLTILK